MKMDGSGQISAFHKRQNFSYPGRESNYDFSNVQRVDHFVYLLIPGLDYVK